MNMNRFVITVLVMLAGSVALLGAQVDIRPSGYVTASAYATPGETPVLDAAGIRGALNIDGRLFSAMDVHASLELYSNLAGINESVGYTGNFYYPAAYECAWNTRTLIDADLKEVWLGFAAGDFDIAIGKQLVTWGQADGTNPTDNINPRYIGTRSVSTSAEKKMGVPMLNLVYNLPSNFGTLQAVFMPLSVSNQMPSMGSFIRDEKPAILPENMEGGFRALLYPGSVSVSVSYLTILDRYPSDVIKMTFIPFPGIYVPSALGHNRQHIIGFDTVYLVNGFDLRTEWAYTLTADAAGVNPYAKNPYISGVVQGSRSFFDNTTTVSLSWAPQYIFHFTKPVISNANMAQLYVGQGYEFENMIGLRIQSNLLNETVKPEALFLAAINAQDYLATLSCTYNIADGWNLKGGANFYGSFRADADPERQIGTFGNDTVINSDCVYLEVRFDF